MQAIFGFAFFIALLGLVVGLIRPKTFARGTNPTPSRLKISSVFLTITVCALAGIGISAPAPAGDARASQAPATPAPSIEVKSKPAPKAITVSAVELYKSYSANEVAADQKYKGKLLQISGTVQSIDKSVFNTIVVHLRSGNEFSSVYAELEDMHEQIAAQLTKGEKINFLCQGGGRLLDSPIVRKCGPT